jgi:hypothetical protein
MQVPAFLLRRLYVKGSLRNESTGFAFDLENTLGTGYADQVLPLRIDDTDIPPAACAFVVDEQTLPFEDVSSNKPMTLAMNRTLTVRVQGAALSPGEHRIEMAFVVTGMGEMRFDMKDVVCDV